MSKHKRKPRPWSGMVVDGKGNLFIVHNGVRITKRGQPNTPQARTWVSLEPGFTVLDDHNDGRYGAIVVHYSTPDVQ